MTDRFESIAAFLSGTDWNAHFTLTFSEVCHRFGAVPQQMDRLMYETFGMSGDELIEQYRKGPMVFQRCRF